MPFDQLAHHRELKRLEQERENWSPFDWFWFEYPKKVGKALAMVKFAAITSEAGLDARTKDEDAGQFVQLGILKATPDQLIEAARKYGRTQAGSDFKLKDDGRYTLQPATFLNKGRFMDYL